MTVVVTMLSLGGGVVAVNAQATPVSTAAAATTPASGGTGSDCSLSAADFAELQALERRPMTMRDWVAKLDAFLRAGDRQILEDAGSISADEAKRKAELEFDQFDRQRRQVEDAQADAQLAQEVEKLAQQAKQLKPPRRKK